jgi:uncharacterized glyoxalase superfamily protein PhnB
MSQSVFPVLRYRDAGAAIVWLEHAFGFTSREVTEGSDGAIVHAELGLDGGVVMVGTDEEGQRAGRSWVYVAVDHPDAHHDVARAVGAEIVFDLADQSYGSREYTARDPEGNLWSFGTYRPG